MPVLLHLAAVQLAGLRVVTPPFPENATPLLIADKMMLRVSTELQGLVLHDIVSAAGVVACLCSQCLPQALMWQPPCEVPHLGSR